MQSTANQILKCNWRSPKISCNHRVFFFFHLQIDIKIFIAVGRNSIGIQYSERNAIISTRRDRKNIKLTNFRAAYLEKYHIFFRALSLSSLQLSVPNPLWYHGMAFTHGKLPPCLCLKKNAHQEFVWRKGWLQTWGSSKRQNLRRLHRPGKLLAVLAVHPTDAPTSDCVIVQK